MTIDNNNRLKIEIDGYKKEIGNYKRTLQLTRKKNTEDSLR